MIDWRGILVACGALVCACAPASAMGYDSLTCGELIERRDGYFAHNGYCPPGGTGSESCKVAPDGAKSLPEAERTQVEMIEKVLVRKSCAPK